MYVWVSHITYFNMLKLNLPFFLKKEFSNILRKKLKILIFVFFSFNSSLFQNIFHCNIPLGRGNGPKVIIAQKSCPMNKKSYFDLRFLKHVLLELVNFYFLFELKQVFFQKSSPALLVSLTFRLLNKLQWTH